MTQVAVVDSVQDTIKFLTGEPVQARVLDVQDFIQEQQWMKRLNTDPAFLAQEQKKRTLRAVRGRWTIKPVPGVKDAWTVRNGQNGHEYTVTAYPTRPPRYTCTCWDYISRCRATPLRCKHIEAVRLWRLTHADKPT